MMKAYIIAILTFVVSMTGLYGQVITDENFDASNGNWTGSSDSGGTYWDWGDPTGTLINDDNGGGGNAWVIGLTGDFNIEEFEVIYLTSQAYDLSGVTANGLVSFAMYRDLGTFNDGFEDVNDIVGFQYSINGVDWNILGMAGTGTNWYNDEMNNAWTLNSGGWLTATQALPAEVLGEAAVQFRFIMFTNAPTGAYGKEGFAFDNFQILSGNTGTDILTMSVPGELFSSNVDNATKTVTLFVAEGTDVTNLAPTFTLSDGATSDIISGTAQNFTSPVTYNITAEINSIIDAWTVEVVNPTPTISLFPASGKVGTEVSIYGKGFSSTIADNSVSFGGVNATVSTANANKLVVTVPAGASLGINEVSVTSNGLNYISAPNFTVVSSATSGVFSDYKLSDFDLAINKSISLEVADFDKDGDLDFAYDDGATLNIATIQDGKITGTVSVASGRSVTTSTLLLEASDVDKNGYPDIIAGGARLGWFKNNGDGTWSAENVIDENNTSTSILVFDADADFDEDIISFDGSGASLFKNSNGGTFALSGASIPNNTGVPIDWDEDGDIDMIAVGEDENTFQESILLLTNDGSGTFAISTLTTTNLTSLQGVEVGDLDNDGDHDFVFVDLNQGANQNTIGYIINNGDGTFGTEVSISVGTTPQEDKKLKLGDLNGDGFLDIARTTDDGFGNGWFYIYLTSASLTYSETELDGSIAGQDLELIDINNDGDLDILQESSASGGYFPLYVQGSTDLNITEFSFAEQTGPATINTTAFTVNIEVNAGADLTALTPTITLPSDAVYVNPASGVANDFSNSVTYTVRTVDNSSSSTQDWTITVVQVPPVPTPVLGTVEQATSEVSWDESSAATGYEFELSEAEDFSTLVGGYDPLVINSGSGATASASLTSLTAGTTYYYRVRAKNSLDTYSSYSADGSFLTKAADPTLTDVALSDIGQDTVNLTWAAVDGVVADYSIEISLGQTFTTLVDGYPVTANLAQFVLGKDGSTTALTPNTTYWIRIAANNATGTSGYSNAISVLTKPATPTVNEVDAALVNQTEATVSWSSVFTTGGSFQIDVSSTDFTTGGTLLNGYPITVGGTSTVIGSDVNTEALQAATNYWVRVRSSNASGESANSNVVSFLTRPATPTDVSVSDIGQDTVKLTWTAATGVVTDYSVEVSLSQTFTTLVSGYPATANSAQFVLGKDGGTAALSPNTTYWIRITANNATGASSYSTAVSVLTKPATPVINAIDLALVNQTDATVSWGSVFTTGGSYNIEVSSTDFVTGGTLLTGYPLTVTGTSAVIGTDLNTQALHTSTNYWVRMRSSNTSGESTNSNVVTFLTRPATPDALPATDILTNSFVANWSTVDRATAYVLEVLDENDNLVFTSNTTLTSALVDQDLSGNVLTQGTLYKYSVKSNNSTGNSPQSNVISVNTNIPPDGLSLDGGTVSENQSIGTFVGTLITADDDDPNGPFTYAFVSGTGDADNASFAINGNNLVTNEVFDFESKSSYSVRVQATDPKGATFSSGLPIIIADANDAPSAIFLETAAYNLTGYDPELTGVGIFSTTDEDADDNNTNIVLELTQGGDSFEIAQNPNNGNEITFLRTGAGVQFTNEVDLIVPITVKATDNEGASTTQDFDITVKAFVDTEPPVFTTFTPPNATTFLIGADYDSLALSAKVEDFRIGTGEVRLFTRLLNETDFTSKVLVESQGLYTDSVGRDDLGIAGIEYYFKAIDEAGNESISDANNLVLAFPAEGENAPKVESVTKFGRTVDSYQIISIPFAFNDPTAKRVDAIFNEYSGDQINREYRIIKWDPNSGASGELVNLTPSSTIELGEGYFFISSKERQITIERANINLQDPFPLELQQGWNLVGNPYNLNIDWTSVVTNNGANDIVGPLRVLNPENPETWPESDVLTTLEGAFVFSSQDITLNVSYTDASISFGGGRIKQESAKAEWFLPITLEHNGDFRKGGIGMDARASTEFDRYDEVVLPKWLEFLELAFLHPGEKFEKYNKDVTMLSDSKVWELDVSSSNHGPATLRWDEHASQVTNLKLYDVQNDLVIDMTAQSTYHFELNETTRFKILYSTDPEETFDFDAVQLGDPYPNPVNDSFTWQINFPNTTITLNAEISMLDMLGREVWVGEKQAVHAGSFEFKVVRPDALESGMYLVQLKTYTDSNVNVHTKRIVLK